MNCSHDDLGPMHHRSGDELQGGLTQRKHIAFLHGLGASSVELLVELCSKLQGLGRSHDDSLGIAGTECAHRTTVVGLVMLGDEVVGLAAIEGLLEFVEPLVGLALIDAIHHGNLLVEDNEAVVTHAFRQIILALEELQFGIVTPDVLDLVGHIFWG